MKDFKDGLKITSVMTLVLAAIAFCLWALVEFITITGTFGYIFSMVILFLTLSWVVGHNLNRVNSSPSKKEVPFYEKIENYPKALD